MLDIVWHWGHTGEQHRCDYCPQGVWCYHCFPVCLKNEADSFQQISLRVLKCIYHPKPNDSLGPSLNATSKGDQDFSEHVKFSWPTMCMILNIPSLHGSEYWEVPMAVISTWEGKYCGYENISQLFPFFLQFSVQFNSHLLNLNEPSLLPEVLEDTEMKSTQPLFC